MDIKEEMPDGDADSELYEDLLLMVKRLAAARPGNAIWINDIIVRIISLHNFERFVLPPA